MTQRKLQRLVEEDILQLRFLLKSHIVGYNVIKQREQKTIDNFHAALHSVKAIERHLRKELKLIDSLRKKAEKEHKLKRWSVIRNVLQRELKTFHNNFTDSRDLAASCTHLNERLQAFQQLLRSARRKPTKAHELKTLRQFTREKQF